MRVRLSGSGVGLGSVVALAVLAALGGPALAQPDPIDFVTIGAPGNAPYRTGNPNDFVNGRGGVNYEYRIGRYEVTTAQWVGFFNAAYDRPRNDWLPHLRPPDFWGAVPTTPNTPGGLRWRVPAGNEMIPTGNISWRMAAMYANWLHNDMSSARAAFMDGAYDVTTFGWIGNIFTDQLAHRPDARYWVPTWDEWLKAAHYDPERNGPGQGGWWQYAITSETAPVYGPPGAIVNGQPAQANAGWTSQQYPGQSPFAVPLGAYAGVASPWGLFDTAGGTTEWTESVRTVNTGTRYRVFDGSYWSQDALQSAGLDAIRNWGGEFPHVDSFEFGLRIASVVPSPATCVAGVGVFLWPLGARRRRTATCNGTDYSSSSARALCSQ